MKKSSNYTTLEAKWQDLRTQIADILQVEDVSLEFVSNLRNGLVARKVQGFSLEDYSSIFDVMTRADSERYSLILTGNPKFLKIITTNFLTFLSYEFNSTVQAAMDGTSDSIHRRKISFLSYHDDQQVELAVALGADLKLQRPPFASTIIHELWHDDSQNPKDCASLEACFS